MHGGWKAEHVAYNALMRADRGRPRKERAPARDLGGLVAELRLSAGLSQRELARRMGVGVASVSSLEKGREPRLSTLRRLARHLPGATPRVLLCPAFDGPDPTPVSLWSAHRDMVGFVARRVALRLRDDGWDLEVIGCCRASRSAGI